MGTAERDERQARMAGRAVWDDVTDLEVCVVGLGRSGVAAANALARRGASVFAHDDKPREALGAALQQLDPRVTVRCGEGFTARPGEIAVMSPGIGPTSPTFHRVKASALAMIGEVELFYRLDRARNHGMGHPIIAVGGTDGKTTTASLIAWLLEAAGRKVALAGNIGRPLCDVLDTLEDDAIVVAEVSAFQTITCPLFRPRVAVLTNIAEDHVDYFGGDFEAYAAAKEALAGNLSVGDTLVVNDDDPRLKALADRMEAGNRASICRYSGAGMLERGLCTDGEWMWHALGEGREIELLDIDDLGVESTRPMVGEHNVSNALAASATAMAMGVDMRGLRLGLRRFELPPHRLQPAGHIGAVRFINDSKATNPHAALAGLRAIETEAGERLVWIGGGSEKGSDFQELADVLAERADCAVLIGETAPRLQALLPSGLKTVVCEHMHDAVAAALHEAGERGLVLLSPACASFGLFRSYEERGQVFMEAVQRLRAAVEQT